MTESISPATFPETPLTAAGLFERPPALWFRYPLPYGALLRDNGTQFVAISRNATNMRLLLYDRIDDREPTEVLQFDRENHRWGHVWSLFVPKIKAKQLYHFQAEGPFVPEQGLRFDGRARLIDPYAKALAGSFQPATDGVIRPPKCVVIDDDDFDWRGDRHLKYDLSKTVIYEMHVRGFTQSKTSRSHHPGSYLGVIDKERIAYLKSLGVTAVELMPIHDFPIQEVDGTHSPRANYWGYDSMAFFAPHRGYAHGREVGAQVHEFKEMVRVLHQNGIEVILDVVFNHTCEGNERGPTLSFRGLDNNIYYMLEHGKFYKNFSGCGNTVNGNHPVMRELIFNCLRYWVLNYHIDGFRFDLASILSRDQEGHLQANPPLIEMIAEDPLLADTKIIAEAWDAAGAYQVGSFGAGSGRWAEWNGKYRDDIRRFWRGDEFMLGAIATRLSGSSDLYFHTGRSPACSINFATSHDGFTLNDLVTYNQKYNLANGEDNRDGDNNNFSCNYGAEGVTTDKEIEATRSRQVRNMLTTLMLSQGVPMLVAGDEIRRTQQGNNNAYCQDNDISWFDWKLAKKNEPLRRFVAGLIQFRLSEPAVRQTRFLTGHPRRPGDLPDVSWFGSQGGGVAWNMGAERSLTCLISAVPPSATQERSNYHVLLMCHAALESRDFVFPSVCQTFDWRLFVDTGAAPPNDIFLDCDGPRPNLLRPLRFLPYSMRVFIATSPWTN